MTDEELDKKISVVWCPYVLADLMDGTTLTVDRFIDQVTAEVGPRKHVSSLTCIPGYKVSEERQLFFNQVQVLLLIMGGLQQFDGITIEQLVLAHKRIHNDGCVEYAA